MVRHILTMLFLLFVNQFVWAGSLIATVDSKQVAIGQGLMLNLELKDAEEKSEPDFSVLTNQFTLVGKSESSKTTIINSQVSKSKFWRVSLLAKTPGEKIIPAITIKTEQGSLQSKPITIHVLSANDLPKDDSEHQVSIKAAVSKQTVFQNQPVIYTLNVVAKDNISNVRLGELSIENAIVESYGQPKLIEKVIDGVLKKTIEAKYLVTPMQSGKLIIPSMAVHADVMVKQKTRASDYFGQDFNRAFDWFEKFNQMDDWFSMSTLKPIVLASQPLVLQVKPPIASVNPWLPASKLSINDQIDTRAEVKVGEPITRTLKLSAQGIMASQLPGLQFHQSLVKGFKIYADKPVTQNTFEQETIQSQREERYTYIPQQSGELILPEIKLAWFNLETNKIDYAVAPKRILKIIPGAGDSRSAESAVDSEKEAIQDNMRQQVLNFQSSPVLMLSITTWPLWLQVSCALILLILIVMVSWIIRLGRQLKKMKDTVEKTQHATVMRPIPLPELKLSKVKTVRELERFWQAYAKRRWEMPGFSSLRQIFKKAKHEHPHFNIELANALVCHIEAGLYANQKVDIDKLKSVSQSLLKALKQKPKLFAKVHSFPGLNPR